MSDPTSRQFEVRIGPPPSLTALGQTLGTRWPKLEQTRRAANNTQERIRDVLAQVTDSTLDNTSVVAFGSLARGDWTSGSDVDWTLLVDGPAVTDHRLAAQQISEMLNAEKFTLPGSAGVFGNLAFSHDIIHHIGGNRDSNINTTQRVLLLLESVSLSPSTIAYDRVVRAVLNRYLTDDLNFVSKSATQNKVPRFLLNDIVRFWRTMCVDCASKEWLQHGHKWAIRNAKLRMSRKLLFVSGMLICFRCYRNPNITKSVDTNDSTQQSLLDFLTGFVYQRPLDIVIQTIDELGCHNKLGPLLTAYDAFLMMLDDVQTRTILSQLSPSEAEENKTFKHIRDISHTFQDALVDLFFDSHPLLSDFTRKYGMF